MGERYWLWVGARLLVGVALVAWVGSYLGKGGGEKEFQKTLEAMKDVHSFRVQSSGNQAGIQHSEMLWEVDCARHIVHYQMHLVNTSVDPPSEMKQDEFDVGITEFDRQSDGTWTNVKYPYHGDPAKAYCSRLAEGTDSNLLPQIATMIKRGYIQKGEKKMVSGVRCREWLVAMRGGPQGLEHDTVCLGLNDHLPYEMTVDWEFSHTSFSDYNTTIHFDGPDAIAQPVSTTTTTN